MVLQGFGSPSGVDEFVINCTCSALFFKLGRNKNFTASLHLSYRKLHPNLTKMSAEFLELDRFCSPVEKHEKGRNHRTETFGGKKSYSLQLEELDRSGATPKLEENWPDLENVGCRVLMVNC